MFHNVTLSQARDRLGHYIREAGHNGHRVLIRRNGREAAALVSVTDFNLLLDAGKSMEFKSFQVAEELHRWRSLHEGLRSAGERRGSLITLRGDG